VQSINQSINQPFAMVAPTQRSGAPHNRISDEGSKYTKKSSSRGKGSPKCACVFAAVITIINIIIISNVIIIIIFTIAVTGGIL